jgi:hypothetical protein
MPHALPRNAFHLPAMVMSMGSPKRMTRKALVACLREQGYPITLRTMAKLCMPSSDQGPPVAAWWGNRPLYEPAAGLAWAEARERPARDSEQPRATLDLVGRQAGSHGRTRGA